MLGCVREPQKAGNPRRPVRDRSPESELRPPRRLGGLPARSSRRARPDARGRPGRLQRRPTRSGPRGSFRAVVWQSRGAPSASTTDGDHSQTIKTTLPRPETGYVLDGGKSSCFLATKRNFLQRSRLASFGRGRSKPSVHTTEPRHRWPCTSARLGAKRCRKALGQLELSQND
jgi:hypothetical protein